MGCGAAAAVAGVAAAGSIASGVIQSGAAGDAAQAQINAIKNEPKLNPTAIADAAQQQDLNRYEQQFQLQQQVDPQSAALRTQGASGILSGLAANAGNNTAADQSLAQLQTQSGQLNAATDPVISQLISSAQSELAAGATLPPSFQQELVTSGLQQSSAAGNSLNGTGAAGSNLNTLLGSAGINLQAQRQQQAQGALSSASSLEQQRANILSGIATLDNTLRGTKMNQAETANQIGVNNVPNIGLSGTSLANLMVGQTNQGQQQAQQIGQLQGQQDLAQGNLLGSLVKGGTNLLSAGLGAYFGSGATKGPNTVNGPFSNWSTGNGGVVNNTGL